MKKYIKWSVFILFSPILLIMILAVMLYLPPVQNWAVRHVAAYASESTGMDVTVDHVKLVFPLRLGVEGVQVLQPIDLKIALIFHCVEKKILLLTLEK